MRPTLVSGNRVIVSPGKIVGRNDLVALRFKHSPVPMVKRVIAVAGDRVEIREDAIFVNGIRTGDFDVNRWRSTVMQLERYGWVVPPENLFVLGDNAGDSRDSRRLGLISTDQVEGRVVRIIRK